MAPIFAGTSQHGFPFAATEMSHFGGGGGARTYADGVDTAGIVFNTTPNMPNIEDQEAEYPVLYLFRRHLRDSGGPGRYRGGRSGELAYTMYDAPGDRLEGLFAGTGAEMPNAIGLAGGLPGAAIRVARVVETDVAGRIARHEAMHRGDVWYHSWQAGGGYGDPLTRDPAVVHADLERGVISDAAARQIYGIATTTTGALALDATNLVRNALRKERLERATAVSSGASIQFAGKGRHEYGEALVIDFSANAVLCGHCGHRHCSATENLALHLRGYELPLNSAGPVRGEDYERGRFQLRHLCCAECAALVDVQVALKDAPRPKMHMTFGEALRTS
jgi:N-methylhydantoinase B